MMGRQRADQGQLFYLFNLEDPTGHLLRRINPTVTRVLRGLGTSCQLSTVTSAGHRPKGDIKQGTLRAFLG